MNDNRKRDIFYGVVAVATLIVALVGATLAYFSISASSNEGAVNAQAATVSIEYNDGQQVTAQADELIPATLDVVQKVYEARQTSFGTENALKDNVCIDDYNQQVCSIYRFTIRSDVERTVTATLNNEENGFTYLSYAVRDVNNNAWLTLDDDNNESLALTQCSNADENTDNDCSKTEAGVKTYSTTPKASNSIFGQTLDTDGVTVKKLTKTVASDTQIYDLVIFLAENNKNQNEDQGKSYLGTIIVDVTDGGMSGIITGKVNE